MSHATSTSAIRIDESSLLHPLRTIPMSIPRSGSEPSPSPPPPPLLPPRHLHHLREGRDPGWQWGNTPFAQRGFGGSPVDTVKPSPPSSLLTPAMVDSFTSEKQLGQRTVESSSHAYDQHLLSRIGGLRPATRATFPNASSKALPSKFRILKPLAVPSDRLLPSFDSPVRCAPPSPAWSAHGLRSPLCDPGSADGILHPRRVGSLSTLDEPHSACGPPSFTDGEFGSEDSGLRELHIEDRAADGDDYHVAKSSLKRRASSPPADALRDDRPTSGSGGELYHRRSAHRLGSRNSPVSRFVPVGCHHAGSLSSVSSGVSHRTGSCASSYGLSTASSVTSFGCSDPRLSPSALSPLTATAESDSYPIPPPYASSRSLNPSPRASLSRPQPRRRLSESEPGNQLRKLSTDSLLHSRQSSFAGRAQGFICECCPKKPKRFDTEDDLRLHEMEKQYTCQFCPNRFKNKNEAERHQNSLHLRQQSWSCAALGGVSAAFHASTASASSATPSGRATGHATPAQLLSSHPGAAAAPVDVCGYCGAEFPNHPAPDWHARAAHLNAVHKFGECNVSKKFFRADHFRQHLKHSHAGTSGKWTNMLETACMRVELPAVAPKPERMSVSGMVSAGGKERVVSGTGFGVLGPASAMIMAGFGPSGTSAVGVLPTAPAAPLVPKPGVIEERDES